MGHFARAPRRFDGVGLESRQDDQRCPRDDGPRHDGQTPDVGQRQTGHPHVASGINAEPGRARLGRGGDGIVCEHDTFGLTRCARGGHDQSIALLDADAIGKRMLFPVRADNPGRTQGVEQHLARHRWQPGIERRRGIARVPNGPERIDEADAPGKIECDELRHRTSA
jgi:hypothetical protein